MSITLRGKTFEFQQQQQGFGLDLGGYPNGKIQGWGLAFVVGNLTAEPSEAEWQQIIDGALCHDLKWLSLHSMTRQRCDVLRAQGTTSQRFLTRSQHSST